MSQPSDEIREMVNRYTPGHTLDTSGHGIERVSIHLFGFLGHGKSSLINSCCCVAKNTSYQNIADAGVSLGGRTMNRREFKLTDQLVLIDNRGFSKCDEREIIEACAQLRSLRDLDVNWDRKYLDLTLTQLQTQQQPADFILPVFVFSASAPMHEWIEEFWNFFPNAYEITGIHPVVVITNADKQSRDNDISSQFGKMGIVQRILLENYTENKPVRNEESDGKILKFLEICMKEAERGIEGRTRSNQDREKIFLSAGIAQIKLEANALEKKNNEQIAALQREKDEQIAALQREKDEQIAALQRENAKSFKERYCSIS